MQLPYVSGSWLHLEGPEGGLVCMEHKSKGMLCVCDSMFSVLKEWSQIF